MRTVCLFVCLLACNPSFSQISKGGGIEKPPVEPNDLPIKTRPRQGGGNILETVLRIETKVNHLREDINKRYRKCYKEKKNFKNLSEIVVHLNIMHDLFQPNCKSHTTEKLGTSKQYKCLINQNIRKQFIAIENEPLLDIYLENHEGIEERTLERLHKDLKLHGTKK